MGDAVGGWAGEVGFEVVACLWDVGEPEGGAGDDGDTFRAFGAVGEGRRTGSRCRRVCRVGEVDGQCSSFSRLGDVEEGTVDKLVGCIEVGLGD